VSESLLVARGPCFIRMLLTESLLLSVVGGVLGLFVAKWSNSYVANFFGFDMPLDFRVMGFTFGVSLITGAAFGTVPAWMASRTDVNVSLRTSGRGATSDRSRHWLRQGLVVTELGLALILLSGAGFLSRASINLRIRNWAGVRITC